jgi:hypothetical protein
MAADSDNEMRDFTDSEGEQERWEEKTGTRAGIGLIKVQAVLRTEHLRKGYLPLKCVFLVNFSLSTNHTGPLSEGSTAITQVPGAISFETVRLSEKRPVQCRTTEKKHQLFFYAQKLINILRVAHYHHFRTEI